MTLWQPRRDPVTKNLTMWRLFRIVDGVEELDIYMYGTQDEANVRMRELNAKEKAPETAATAQGAEE
jgi:hypothetical protein|nr:MAG TPA: hypothetical protein [Bacteriophage sp.]